MAICAVFGNSMFNYKQDLDRLEKIICNLIENEGVTEFWTGGRGDFDRLCAKTVYELKEKYPFVKLTLIFSYVPTEAYVPKIYDESLYLLENPVPPRFAISHTNRKMVEKCDIVLSGVRMHFGGAWQACDYARQKKKPIVRLYPESTEF